MGAINIILLIAVAAFALRMLKKDFDSGLAFCVGLLVLMPDYLRISFGGGIPEMTIHRVLVLLLLVCWMSESKTSGPRPQAPLLRGLLALGATEFISLLFSISPMSSVKSLFVYSLEVVLMFVILTTSLRDREAVLRVLNAIALGLGFVALFAWIEKYRSMNYPRQLLLGDGEGLEDVTSTYPHRILLGYATAMGVPLMFALAEHETRKLRKRLFWVALLMLMAACYFSNSRGPWSGLLVGLVLFFFLGSRATKRSAVVIAGLALIALVVKPGVRETVRDAINSTFETDSVKGKSYEYRWTLWHISFSEVRKAPQRMLFGYGGLSTEGMDLSDYFDKESGGGVGLTGFTSWDNQFACDLIEFGYVGLLIEAGLLFSVLGTLFSLWLRCEDEDKSFLAAFISATLIYMYAMSNVYIFSPQLKCLFWALAGCGLRLGVLLQEESQRVARATVDAREALRGIAAAPGVASAQADQ